MIKWNGTLWTICYFGLVLVFVGVNGWGKACLPCLFHVLVNGSLSRLFKAFKGIW